MRLGMPVVGGDVGLRTSWMVYYPLKPHCCGASWLVLLRLFVVGFPGFWSGLCVIRLYGSVFACGLALWVHWSVCCMSELRFGACAGAQRRRGAWCVLENVEAGVCSMFTHSRIHIQLVSLSCVEAIFRWSGCWSVRWFGGGLLFSLVSVWFWGGLVVVDLVVGVVRGGFGGVMSFGECGLSVAVGPSVGFHE